MKIYYLSKNYRGIDSAGNKAKTDIEKIMANMHFKNVGLKQTIFSNKVLGFIVTLIGVLKAPFFLRKGNLFVLQYPLKKYYTFLCVVAHLRGCRVITIIHDLGSFRRRKLTVEKEIQKLNRSDYIVAHNKAMKNWLEEHGCLSTISCLGIFDYLSKAKALHRIKSSLTYRVVYAGGLSYKKNAFLYQLDDIVRSFDFDLYGNGFEFDRIKNKKHFVFKGFIPSEQLIATSDGDFGLVWDGDSINVCKGEYGEYLKYNNPHKTSLYIRCELPIIIWKEAALASFVIENKIGVCVDSLHDLDGILLSISTEQYMEMKENIRKISERLSCGYYISSALKKFL